MSGLAELWLARHGESEANIAADLAERAGAETIDVPARDPDVRLSPVGMDQARALGEWLARSPGPDVVWSSPYLRALDTARLALATAGRDDPITVDERLRDRELGILDALTSLGVEARYPLEAQRRRWLGKYFYRPPGGESWADVALRLRSALADLDARFEGQRVLIVAHDAVVRLVAHVCLGWTEEEVLAHDLAHPIPNASVTRLVHDDEGWKLVDFASSDHLVAEGAPVTEHAGDKDVDVH
ncbi:histidine phosphatase family protein [soil metagenome]